MNVTDGNGQCICRIVWFWKFVKVQQGLNHALHLAFCCIAITTHRLLNFIGCVFIDRQRRLGKAQQNDAACLTN